MSVGVGGSVWGLCLRGGNVCPQIRRMETNCGRFVWHSDCLSSRITLGNILHGFCRLSHRSSAAQSGRGEAAP